MISHNQNNVTHSNRAIILLGSTMVIFGAIVLSDQYLRTGWLSWAALFIMGSVFLLEGSRNQKMGWLISGSLVAGGGLGALLVILDPFVMEVPRKIGLLLLSFAIGWCLITATSALSGRKIAFWALVPGGIFAALALCLLFSDLSLLAFVFYIVTGIGLVLLIWGLFWRLYGLVIPGSLLLTIGPGIAVAWGSSVAVNPLSKTGLMIAAFSFGWGLIVFFTKVISAKFVWWPLIPGGILAMVGWGLYIGGDPGNAPSFIANTGSVGLIIFGLYLLLLRKSIHR